MGNQPSSPTSAPTPEIPATLTPPLPPPCDLECQKQKQLALLKKNLDSVDPESDPAGYEKARIAYFTLLNGPGWLAQEKQRIASQEVEPVLKSYQQQFDALKGEQQSQDIFTKLANGLKAQELVDEQDSSFLKKRLQKEKDKAATLDRINQLQGEPSSASKYIGWIIDIVIALLGLFVLYKGYTKFFGQITMSPTQPDLSSV